ncbi:Rv1733c family protein [Streptomyces sp. NBC_01477]|uniref:Rv1733c family protein n=1 Tax=Streptomyces sp. NBC_01477 TaxID=2976015 RepID=UPI002E317096|nr:hypothetical protein [Streptomyces sp. NBC_01477]
MKRSAWLWRLRSNPLRRRSYAVEAWTFLAVGLVAMAGAILAGALSAQHLEDRYTQQRLERHSTRAVLTEDAPDASGAGSRVLVPARWTAPDGTSRTGSVKAVIGSARGTQVSVWADTRGALMTDPLSAPGAQIQADVIGGWTALAIFTGAVLGCGTTARLLNRRRATQWAAEWAAVGPQWDHRDA